MLYPFTLIQYQTSGDYREDNWTIITTCNSDNDVYNALKKGYLQDSRNRNNYPIVAHAVGRIYGLTCNLPDGIYYSSMDSINLKVKDGSFATLQQSYGYKKYEKWKCRVKTLVPKIRDVSKKRATFEYEIETLYKLAKKHNYTLTKVL